MKYEKTKEDRSRRKNIPKKDYFLTPNKNIKETIKEWLTDSLLLLTGIVVVLAVIYVVMIYIVPLAVGLGVLIGAHL